MSLQHVLPCKYCRVNLGKNLIVHPLTAAKLKSRAAFSKYIYELHEIVNKMLHKKSGLTYLEVRKRYEHFRSRCTESDYRKRLFKFGKTRKYMGKKKEKGCVKPFYGNKSKCIIKIVPANEKCETFQMDKSCMRK
jgi:hypothetical protein